MRILGVMLLVLLTGWTAAPLTNPPPQATADRSWVPSDAVIYGADRVHGFYRFALNQAQQLRQWRSSGTPELPSRAIRVRYHMAVQIEDHRLSCRRIIGRP
jgi:hypothetical protein